jgi:hypothetical protein
MTNSSSTSEIILGIAKQHKNQETILVGDIVISLNERSFGILLILFCALPALPLPAPPVITTILALPIFILSLQLLIGKKQPWLPNWLSKKSIKQSTFQKITGKLVPMIKKIEPFYKPRCLYMTSALGEKLIGLAGVIFALSISLPIPFSNTIPSIGVLVMAIGLIEKDGIIVKIGMLIGTIGVTITCMIYVVGASFVYEWFAQLKNYMGF